MEFARPVRVTAQLAMWLDLATAMLEAASMDIPDSDWTLAVNALSVALHVILPILLLAIVAQLEPIWSEELAFYVLLAAHLAQVLQFVPLALLGTRFQVAVASSPALSLVLLATPVLTA